MSAGRIGVAISTTGDKHRLDLLRRAIAYWRAAQHEASGWKLEPDAVFVTVDGDDEAMRRVTAAVGYEPVNFYQVGQPAPGMRPFIQPRDGRLGVAANKNTGLELLMDAGVDQLFLSDDDTWPLRGASIDLHVSGNLEHSMVCWGKHRLAPHPRGCEYAAWTWPRGSMLHTTRSVVDTVGGMIEAFGPGGHEHVEWSRRIHEAGLTPVLYPSPSVYAALARGRGVATGAAAYWHAEDMPRQGEGRASLMSRKRATTSVRRMDGDWEHIEKIMQDAEGSTSFVAYQASANGRSSATLYQSNAN